MTDEDKKLLTEFLNECWHEYEDSLHCIKCGGMDDNRTFTTAQDMQDLKDKLVEKGKWESFYREIYRKSKFSWDCMFIDWLWRPESCQLVADFLKERDR